MIPLFPNIGYAEISSAGTLNDAMGSAKTQLPIQFFKLTDNISGNLTMTNESIHKKIIIDTNGKNITNSSGSPITNNSSIDVELKGSGNVQSTLKTFNTAITSTSNTGTTTFDNSDSSTVVVDTDFTFDTNLTSFSGQQTSGNGVDGFFNTTFGTYLGGRLLTNVNTAAFRMQFNDAFVEDNPKGGGLIVGPGGGGQSGYTSNAGRSCSPVVPSSNTVSGGFRTMVWANAGFDPRKGGNYTITILLDTSDRARVVISQANDVRFILPSNGVIPDAVTTTGRRMIFTNNLAIPVVLSGADPFDGVTVASGATSTANISAADGSFDITGTVSGSNDDSEPFALASVNNGTGDLITTGYTGTLSASGL